MNSQNKFYIFNIEIAFSALGFEKQINKYF